MKLLQLWLSTITLCSLSHAETLYISALKTKILKDPNSQSQTLEEINRGEAIEIKKTEGPWLQITYKNKMGWISKLFTTKNPPLKNSDINNLKKLDSDKVGRVRLNYENKGAGKGQAIGGVTAQQDISRDSVTVYFTGSYQM